MAKPSTRTGDGETAGMSPRTQRGGMRLRAARRYLRCWCCCCCKYFAGYQHGLVSKPCVWLHPESRGREGGKRENKKEKKTNEKGRKEMSKQLVTSAPSRASREAGARWASSPTPHPRCPPRSSGGGKGGSASVIRFAQNQTTRQGSPCILSALLGCARGSSKQCHAGLLLGDRRRLWKDLGRQQP